MLASVVAAVPTAAVATGISDSTVVSDALRYVYAPGTMLAVRIVRVEGSHRGLGVFLDAVSGYARVMSYALMFNSVFYALLIFGILTTVSGVKSKPERRSTS